MISLFHVCDFECGEYKNKNHPIEGRWVIGEYSFDRCPLTELTERTDFILTAYKMFKNGFLPNSGGWLQQSNKFIEAMDFIDMKINEYKAKQEAKNGRQ